MKTFTRIEHLLNEIDRLERHYQSLIRARLVSETGHHYLGRVINETRKVYNQLNDFPLSWIEAVRLIKSLRN